MTDLAARLKSAGKLARGCSRALAAVNNHLHVLEVIHVPIRVIIDLRFIGFHQITESGQQLPYVLERCLFA